MKHKKGRAAQKLPLLSIQFRLEISSCGSFSEDSVDSRILHSILHFSTDEKKKRQFNNFLRFLPSSSSSDFLFEQEIETQEKYETEK